MVHSRANKIALFIDGANFQATARALGFAIDYKRLLREFQSHGTLVRAFYYIAIAEDQEYSPLRPLIDWLGYNAYRVVTKATKAAPTSRATPRITPQVVSRHESGRPAGFGFTRTSTARAFSRPDRLSQSLSAAIAICSTTRVRAAFSAAAAVATGPTIGFPSVSTMRRAARGWPTRATASSRRFALTVAGRCRWQVRTL